MRKFLKALLIGAASLGILALFTAASCSEQRGKKFYASQGPNPEVRGEQRVALKSVFLKQKDGKTIARAVFAGGCFWCMEPPYEKLPGVRAVISGYAGGREKNPRYRQVAYGRTTHVEAVLVEYDPEKISFEKLLDVFWRNVNPTQANGQFVDIGPHYRTVIYYIDDAQRKGAQVSKKKMDASGRFPKPIVTEITPIREFWRAEDYHQDYYKKNPAHYYRYRKGSGRDAYIQKIWGKK